MMTEEEIKAIVAQTITEQLAPCSVELQMRRGTDEDGDAVLNIMVIMQTECIPDRRKMLGLARHLRSSLMDAVDAGFPVLSFVSKHDAAKLNFEAA